VECPAEKDLSVAYEWMLDHSRWTDLMRRFIDQASAGAAPFSTTSATRLDQQSGQWLGGTLRSGSNLEPPLNRLGVVACPGAHSAGVHARWSNEPSRASEVGL